MLNTQEKQPLLILSLLSVSIVCVYFISSEGLNWLVNRWNSEEYSYGYLVPFVSAYLIWNKYDRLLIPPIRHRWIGFVLVIIGLFLLILSKYGSILALFGFAFLTLVAGVLISVLGVRRFRVILPEYALLFFAIPLPGFVFNNLSAELQLISSQIGVWFIRLFDISVFLEGNVIDLGEMKLQVVEACSGLRYLFPLMTIAYMVALFYRAPFWQRALIFASSVPITVLMNSIRIGVIGILVERWGSSMAEGFIHSFQGWAVFMSAFTALLLEIGIMTMIFNPGKRFFDVLRVDEFSSHSRNSAKHLFSFEKRNFPYYASVSGIILAALFSASIPEPAPVELSRKSFSEFPQTLGEWTGDQDALDDIFVEALDMDDYLLSKYFHEDYPPINLYIAYYDAQETGSSIHSPRNCLPGGGWQIIEFSEVQIDGVELYGKPLRANRVLMALGDSTQLVYYWFQQRGRVLTGEFENKWMLFLDSIFKRRSDGALIRLSIPAHKTSPTEFHADAALTQFVGQTISVLPDYIPN